MAENLSHRSEELQKIRIRPFVSLNGIVVDHIIIIAHITGYEGNAVLYIKFLNGIRGVNSLWRKSSQQTMLTHDPIDLIYPVNSPVFHAITPLKILFGVWTMVHRTCATGTDPLARFIPWLFRPNPS